MHAAADMDMVRRKIVESRLDYGGHTDLSNMRGFRMKAFEPKAKWLDLMH